MNKTWKKVIAVALCSTLIAGIGTSYACLSDKADTDDVQVALAADETTSALTIAQSADIKDEVRDIADKLSEELKEDGVYQDETVYVIASNKGEVTKLIVNDKVKDNADGSETFAQSEVNAAVPVDISVAYRLDGNEIEPEALAGKSGHVTITYSYVNNEVHSAKVSGKNKDMYVPFAVVTGMLLDNETFTNVTVEGGRVVGDGSRQAAVGIAFPGLREDLECISKEGLDVVEIPDNFVIEADVTDFKLGNSYTFVTNINLGSNESGSVKDIFNSLSGQVGDAMAQLLDGSVQLKDGLNKAADAEAQLKDGSAKLYAGAKELDGGIDTVAAGLKQIDSNSAALVAGAGQVFDSLLATANEGLAGAGLTVPALTKDNYAAVIDGALTQLDATAADTMAKYQAAAAAGMVTPEMKAQIEAGSKQLEAGKAKLTELKASLDSYNTFYQGITAYTAGVSQVTVGAGRLATGSDTLVAGLAALDEGNAALYDGLNQLADGSAALNTGLQTLSDEVVNKLVEILNDDATEITETLGAIADISEEYKSLNGLGGAEDGKVKFIYKLGDIR